MVAATFVCSGFKVLVDGCDIQHDVLPVRPLSARHFIDVQSGFDSNTFSCLESQGEVPFLILAVQFLIRYVGWEIGVKQCAESQSVVPAAAEVCDVDILIAFCFFLTPLQQGVPLGSSIFSCQC